MSPPPAARQPTIEDVFRHTAGFLYGMGGARGIDKAYREANVLGGTLAASSQAAKTTTRAAVNTSPEPFSNIGMSLAGDAFVPTVLWLSWTHPVVLAAVLVLSVLVAIGLIVVLGKFLRALLRRASGWLRGGQPSV